MGARTVAALVVALALTGGCGGGSGDPVAGVTPADLDSERRVAERLGGVDAADDLSGFSCAPNDDGRWRASGVITNGTDRRASYAVTVLVAGAETAEGRAKERTLVGLRTGEPTKFTILDVPVASGSDPTCTVRVVRLR